MAGTGIGDVDNSGISTPSPAAPSHPEATTPQGAVPDKFAGQSKEQIIAHYTELEKRASRSEAEKKEYADFIGRVGHFFKVDENTGTVDFNDDVLRPLALSRKWVPEQGQSDNTQNPTATNNHSNNSEDDMAALQENPREYMRNILREEIHAALKDSVEPLQQIVFKDRNEAWVNDMRNKHPDFDDYRTKIGDYLSKSGARVSTKQDLENAYLAAKAIHGGFIDAKQHKEHVNQLMSTLQEVNPRAGQPVVDERTASVKSLLGMENQNSEGKGRIEALFGKSMLAKE